MAHIREQAKLPVFLNMLKTTGKLNKIAFEQKAIFPQFLSQQTTQDTCQHNF